MASILNLCKEYINELDEMIAWAVVWKEGRSWGMEMVWPEYDEKSGVLTIIEDEYTRLTEIAALDDKAILLNPLYNNMGIYADERTNPAVVASCIREFYEKEYTLTFSEFLKGDAVVVESDEESAVETAEPVISDNVVERSENEVETTHPNHIFMVGDTFLAEDLTTRRITLMIVSRGEFHVTARVSDWDIYAGKEVVKEKIFAIALDDNNDEYFHVWDNDGCLGTPVATLTATYSAPTGGAYQVATELADQKRQNLAEYLANVSKEVVKAADEAMARAEYSRIESAYGPEIRYASAYHDVICFDSFEEAIEWEKEWAKDHFTRQGGSEETSPEAPATSPEKEEEEPTDDGQIQKVEETSPTKKISANDKPAGEVSDGERKEVKEVKKKIAVERQEPDTDWTEIDTDDDWFKDSHNAVIAKCSTGWVVLNRFRGVVQIVFQGINVVDCLCYCLREQLFICGYYMPLTTVERELRREIAEKMESITVVDGRIKAVLKKGYRSIWGDGGTSCLGDFIDVRCLVNRAVKGV